MSNVISHLTLCVQQLHIAATSDIKRHTAVTVHILYGQLLLFDFTNDVLMVQMSMVHHAILYLIFLLKLELFLSFEAVAILVSNK